MRLLVLVFLACFFSSAFSLSIASNVSSIEKGQNLELQGKCSESVKLEAFQENKELFEESLECIKGNFLFSKNVAMNLPSGEWKIIAVSGKERSELLLEVKNSRESAFLTIVFQKPEQETIQRKSVLEIVVMVSDAGKKVENAVVHTWNADGKKILLENSGNGFYSAKFEIPFDAVLGEFELVIAAAAEKNGSFVGGETRRKLDVSNALILIELIEPKNRILGVNEGTNFVVSASYNDKTALAESKIFLVAADKNFVFRKQDNLFVLNASFGEELKGEREFRVVAFDSAGNNSAKSFQFVVQENQFRLSLAVLVFFAALIILLFLFWPAVKGFVFSKMQSKQLKKKKILLQKNLVDLQKRYYSGEIKDRQLYKKKASEIQSELSRIEAVLKKEKNN